MQSRNQTNQTRRKAPPKDWITYLDDYSNFDSDNLRAGEVIDGSAGNVPFKYFLIEYNYPGVVGSLYVEEHDQSTNSGIVVKVYPGKNTYTITTKLRRDVPLDAKLIEIYEAVDKFCFRNALTVISGKDVSVMSDEIVDALTEEWRNSIFQSKDEPEEMVLYRDVRYVTWADRRTGKDMVSKAVFSLPMTENGDNSEYANDYPWDELTNKSFSFCPIIQFYRFFSGAAKSVKTSIYSGCISTEITESTNSAPSQEKTKERLVKNNPELVSKIHANAKRMALLNQNLGEVGALFSNGDVLKKEEPKKKLDPSTMNSGIGAKNEFSSSSDSDDDDK